MSNVTAYPLTWPAGWKRTTPYTRKRARFGKQQGFSGRKQITVAVATSEVYEQLRIMGFRDWNSILSTNLILRLDGYPRSGQSEPTDPGASIWWRKDDDQQFKVLAIDQYDRVADNIYAIGKTLEAMRGIERWGGGEILERTFTGFTALPSPEMAGVGHYSVIGVEPGASAADKMSAYRRALSSAHPDKGGTVEQFYRVTQAGKALGLA